MDIIAVNHLLQLVTYVHVTIGKCISSSEKKSMAAIAQALQDVTSASRALDT